MLNLRKLIFFLTYVTTLTVSAQVTADFSSDEVKGCPPLNITFSDSSSSNVVYRHWDFGNGNTSSGNFTSPSAVYTNSGFYTVSLTVSDGVDTVTTTKVNYIEVYNPPTASFYTQPLLTGCAPFDFQVTNTSLPGSVPINSWSWDFDDGTSADTGLSVTHTFGLAGTFNVTLTVTDTLGCSNTHVKPNLVVVKPQPFANFHTQLPPSKCGPPLPFQINSTSQGSPTNYLWTITNPLGTSFNYSTQNIQGNLTTPGGYDVSLIAGNSLGCYDTITIPDYLWIGSITASMDIPDTACPNTDITFYNTSSGGSTFTWDFGDGNAAFGPSVSHNYASPGTYVVTLIAAVDTTCADTITQNLVIENVVADFSSTPDFACQAPLLVTFTDLSIGNIVDWKWYFGISPGSQRDSSIVQNPTNSYSNPGYYDDTLTVTSATGCVSTLIKPANEYIHLTQANFLPDSAAGCVPFFTNFTNNSTPFDSIDYVEWSFGDGSPLDTNYHTSHTFNTTGTFFVTLTVYSLSGCMTTHMVQVRVGTKQNANFVADTNIACASNGISFTNLSTDTNIITKYFWEFGDDKSSEDKDPVHEFQDTGYMSISLIVFDLGCPDTMIIDSAVYINGPFVRYSPEVNCDTPNVYYFNPVVKGGTNFIWDFGDSIYDSVNLNVIHTYPPVVANYSTSLLVWDTVTGCTFSKGEKINIRFLEGVISSNDSNYCLGDIVEFNTNNSTQAISIVQWALNDTNNFVEGKSEQYYHLLQKGTNEIWAVVSDVNGCTDTVVYTIEVYEPIANFVADTLSGCAALSVDFTDLSSSDTNIVGWNWNFGNSTFSNSQNPTALYNGDGTTWYEVTLTVTDTFGCKNKVSKYNYIEVIEPPAYFEGSQAKICDLDSVYFSQVPMGSYTYDWDFGDGGTANFVQGYHQYGVGTFTVSLTVTDTNGCDSTFVRPVFIDSQAYPVAKFVSDKDSTDCFPESIVFTDSTSGSNILSRAWNFGDSPQFLTTSNQTIQNLYTQPGKYDITLVVTTTYGCVDTLIMPEFIYIGGPAARIEVDPAIGCVGEPVTFKVDSANSGAQVFVWDFGTGVLDTTLINNPNTSNVFNSSGNYVISVIFSDSLGLCQKSDQLTLEIDEVIAQASVSDIEGCTPLKMTLINLSTGGDESKWYLNNSLISSDSIHIHSENNPGTGSLMLIASDSRTKCADTSYQNIEVFPLPNIIASDDAVVCVGDSKQLNASGGEGYKWIPSKYLSNPNSYDPVSTPDSNITYIVQGVDSNQCINFDTVSLEVQFKPELLLFPTDTVVFRGQDYNIYTLADMDLLYSWTPEYMMDCIDCSDPIVSPDTDVNIQLQYSDVNNCFVSDTSFNIRIEEAFNVFIPNAFTPNWNGDNDLFHPVTYGVKELEYMQIYDRWGNMVYETNDLSQGWDGRVKGKIVAHNSVFTYKIRVRKFTEESVEYVGMVVLVSP